MHKNIVMKFEASTDVHAMQKEIQWLEKLARGLETLEEHEFTYHEFTNSCGTVRCAFGWMHRFVPESGVIAKMEKYPINVFSEIYNSTFKIVRRHSKFHTSLINVMGYDLMRFIFYGSNVISKGHRHYVQSYMRDLFYAKNPEFPVYKDYWRTLVGNSNYDSTLEQVINKIDIITVFIDDCVEKSNIKNFEHA